MRTFSAKVRLSGSLYNEVPKTELTVPEIIVLRALHGADSVVDIRDNGAPISRTAEEERNRLELLYGKSIRRREEISGGMGALIGFAGPLPDAGANIPLPESAKKATVRKAKEPEVEPELPLEPAMED